MRTLHQYGFTVFCIPLFFLFFLAFVALFPSHLAVQAPECFLISRGNPDRYARGLLNVPEQFHFLRGNASSKKVFRFHPFSGATPSGISALIQFLLLPLFGMAVFFRTPDCVPILHFLTKHCPVRAGPAF